jgi:hypothetical protein
MAPKRYLSQSDPTPFIISPKRSRNAVHLVTMPLPIEVPPGLLPASDNEHPREIITASDDHESAILPPCSQHHDNPFHVSGHVQPEVFPSLLHTHGDSINTLEDEFVPPPAQAYHDLVHTSAGDETTAFSCSIDNHCDSLYVNESHPESGTVNTVTL